LFGDEMPKPATDIWACGILFISLLAKRIPISKCSDELRRSIGDERVVKLIEFSCLLGSEPLVELGMQYDHHVILPPSFIEHT
jgi:hypothetical protein